MCVYEKEKVENTKILKNISSFINKYLAFIELILQHWICKHKSGRGEYLPSKRISCKSWHSIVWFGWLFHLDLLLLLLSLANHWFWHFPPYFSKWGKHFLNHKYSKEDCCILSNLLVSIGISKLIEIFFLIFCFYIYFLFLIFSFYLKCPREFLISLKEIFSKSCYGSLL